MKENRDSTLRTSSRIPPSELWNNGNLVPLLHNLKVHDSISLWDYALRWQDLAGYARSAVGFVRHAGFFLPGKQCTKFAHCIFYIMLSDSGLSPGIYYSSDLRYKQQLARPTACDLRQVFVVSNNGARHFYSFPFGTMGVSSLARSRSRANATASCSLRSICSRGRASVQ